MARRVWTALLIFSTAAVSWLAMMIVHEAGHVLHAILSGGTVQRVVLHPLEISRTDVSPNPHPHFVAWGGAVWGCVLPVAAWRVADWTGLRTASLLRFFAGFCLIANGAYLGAGVLLPVGDAADLLRHGTPRWLLGLCGAIAISLGLWIWHGLGPRFGVPRIETPALRLTALVMLCATVLICIAELVLSAP
jgi:hypothetical protein